MRLYLINILLILNFFITYSLKAQQIPDTSFTYNIKQTAYQQGKGPVILIDGAHNNFHTVDGNFFAFAKLMRQDGYQVSGLTDSITSPEQLKRCKILVIANALHSSNTESWALPTPSAFSKVEINNIKNWVENGGSLFLIADHMPFAGAAYELGNAFGFEFINGFAYTRKNSWPPSVYSRKDNTLNDSPITNGNQVIEQINEISTFTGSAFKAPSGAIPILSFVEENYILKPDTAWIFNDDTPKQKLGGYNQGAIMEFGKGKVAVFGEAAMFTAQLVRGDFKVGFNSDQALQNAPFTLNLIHWLDKRD
ncbi:MAG: DUF4350 domain-containing protein [Ignavibacteriales bacterium]|nr:MAG: DUF4350 domain-containing protein [Ignavibacteriales bacterium]